MTRTFHLCQSVRGPLTNWTWRDWQQATKWMTGKDGRIYTANELKQEFLNLLADGKEVIPIGECDNFDFKTGCQGHPTEAKEDDYDDIYDGGGASALSS